MPQSWTGVREVLDILASGNPGHWRDDTLLAHLAALERKQRHLKAAYTIDATLEDILPVKSEWRGQNLPSCSRFPTQFGNIAI